MSDTERSICSSHLLHLKSSQADFSSAVIWKYFLLLGFVKEGFSVEAESRDMLRALDLDHSLCGNRGLKCLPKVHVSQAQCPVWTLGDLKSLTSSWRCWNAGSSSPFAAWLPVMSTFLYHILMLWCDNSHRPSNKSNFPSWSSDTRRLGAG